jgi:hypothetical protein
MIKSDRDSLVLPISEEDDFITDDFGRTSYPWRGPKKYRNVCLVKIFSMSRRHHGEHRSFAYQHSDR